MRVPGGTTRPPVRAPDAAGLLQAWEGAQHAVPARRALLLLAASGLETAEGDLPVGQRNLALLRSRSLLFGDILDAVAPCPDCDAQLETQIPISALLAGAQPDVPPAEGTVTVGGYVVAYRVPTAADVADVAESAPADLAVAAGRLLRRCVRAASRDGVDVPVVALPAAVTDAVTEAVRDADPDALWWVDLTCPDCRRGVRLALDPAAFLWADVDRWAWRVLAEVNQLAAAYGWDETRILALSPWRRQAYLALSAGYEPAPAALTDLT